MIDDLKRKAEAADEYPRTIRKLHDNKGLVTVQPALRAALEELK